MTPVQRVFDLSGAVAIVTGAGTGLAVSFASAPAEAGAKVVCGGRALPKVERPVAGLRERGFKSDAIHADVTAEEEVVDLVRATDERHGGIDVLVNNAGIAAAGPPAQVSLAEWRAVRDVNLTGVVVCAREAAKAMIADGRGGRIVDIASILGAVAPEPAPAAAFNASKGAVVTLPRELAVHWGRTASASTPSARPTSRPR